MTNLQQVDSSGATEKTQIVADGIKNNQESKDEKAAEVSPRQSSSECNHE